MALRLDLRFSAIITAIRIVRCFADAKALKQQSTKPVPIYHLETAIPQIVLFHLNSFPSSCLGTRSQKLA